MCAISASCEKNKSVNSNTSSGMKRVTGIGGIFFKCKDPQAMREWYKSRLGLNTDKYGTAFEWRQADDPAKKGFSQWSPFAATTEYFKPSEKEFMINYRVHDLVSLVRQLKEEGVIVTDTIEEFEYGKFVHIMDPEGNKIELWEPVDEEFDRIAVATTK
jgi:predicted enzyme related to lactoylglutathione lyase